MNKRIYNTIIILICFLSYRYSKYFFGILIFGKEQWNNLPLFISGSILLVTGIVLAFLANYLINKNFSLESFGLTPSEVLRGLLFATVFSLPMFLCLGLANRFNFQPTTEILFKGFVLAGFGEEFVYRAFLFGLLFYYAGWGFLSAGIFAGLFFGAGHLYQADSIGSAIAIFLFTTGASIGFGWFYYVWKSLWMVAFLHGFMDVIWDSFHIETNVTGSVLVNIARFSTLIFAIVYSVITAKKNNRLDLKSKLWLNHT